MSESEEITTVSGDTSTNSGRVGGTYVQMFEEYLDASPWAKKPQYMLFVFHVRTLCSKLDDEETPNAALSGAYLNAIKALEARRPGAPPERDLAGDGGTGQQASILDLMDDD